MLTKILLPALFLLPYAMHAQSNSKQVFGDHLLVGANYGFAEDFVGDRSNQYEVAHYLSTRAGISMTRYFYAGIQSRFIWARNFETPSQNFYMAGFWARSYLLHPAWKESSNRVGVFLESGFMMGNYAFEDRNSVAYSFEQAGSWYIPFMLWAEFRVWKNLCLEGGLNLYYNNGKNWNEQGLAPLRLGINYHW
ncbi:MAG: hypothetical protein Q7U74_16530 [Saprospiraceae bacterium]|nr:hypothetical protein [Saprospiraceae bacterium]